MSGQRKWVPDVYAIAEQLVADYRGARDEHDGDDRAQLTLETEMGRPKLHGEEFTEDDWVALVLELARRVAESDD